MAYHRKKRNTTRRKKAPKGFHYMPDGRLMRDSAHKKKKKRGKRKG